MKSLLAAAGIALALAAPASAQMMGSYPQDFANAARAYGSAQLDMGTGDQQPLVTGTIDGARGPQMKAAMQAAFSTGA